MIKLSIMFSQKQVSKLRKTLFWDVNFKDLDYKKYITLAKQYLKETGHE